jgi:hypothetical protein
MASISASHVMVSFFMILNLALKVINQGAKLQKKVELSMKYTKLFVLLPSNK